MSDDEIIAVVKAHKEGKKIQFQPLTRAIPWLPHMDSGFNFVDYEYRVKPEPRKPREWVVFGDLKGATFVVREVIE